MILLSAAGCSYLGRALNGLLRGTIAAQVVGIMLSMLLLISSLHADEFAALHLLTVHVEGYEVHAFWQCAWAPCISVLTKGVGSRIAIYYHTSDIGKYQLYLVCASLPYDIWDIYHCSEWVRIWQAHLHSLHR